MRFWDSSAIVPFLLRERASGAVRALLRSDPEMIVWRFAATEVIGALWRRHRSHDVTEDQRKSAERGLGELERIWTSVEDVAHVDVRARRLLGLHPLRTAGALHLAAALVVSDERPELLDFVTLDDRLADAARREGFRVLPES